MPIGKLGPNIATLMEFAALAGLILFLVSETLPFTPLKGNGIVDAILQALMKAFPRPERPE
jgi:hypothetical protein